MNYFELFDIPVSFEINNSYLETKYLELQLKHHPDRNIGSEASVDSATINNGYNTLKHDIERAKYILQLNGVALAQNIDFEFLEIIMELKETNDVNQVTALKAELMSELEIAFRSNDLRLAAQTVAKIEMLKRF